MPNRAPGLCALLILICTGLLGQSATVTRTFERVPLREVLQVFEEEYGFRLAYEEKAIAGRSVSIQLQQATAGEAFYRILDAAGLDYLAVADNKILIRPQPPRLPAPAQRILLRGQIVDAADGTPLPFGSVLWQGHSLGACADADGRFELLLPDTLSEITLQSRYIGYATKELRVSLPAPQELEVRLEPAPLSVPEVLVIGSPAYLSSDPATQADRLRPTANLPGLGGQLDPMRQLQLLPGVAAYNDFATGLQVRGGTPDENLMVWDGMVLYNLDHFFGIFSAVDGELVEEVRLYRNSFPAEYGGRTSSIIEIDASREQPAGSTGHVQLSNLAAAGHIDLPLGESMSLLAGGRFTHSDLGESPLFDAFQQQLSAPVSGGELDTPARLVQVQPDFRFYDAYAKYRWRPSKRSYLEANYFRSYDAYSYAYRDQFRIRADGQLGVNEVEASEVADWKNQAASLQWMHRWGAAFESRASLCYSTYRETEVTRSSLSRIRIGGSEQELFETNNLRDNSLEGWHFNWRNEWKPDSSTSYRFGYRYAREATRLAIGNNDLPLLLRNNEAQQHALYAGGSYRPGALEWSWAVHGTYYGRTSSLHLSPRLRAHWQINPRWGLEFSLSRYHQFLRRYYYENRFGRSVAVWTMADGRNLPVAHANQATIGGRYKQGGFRVEGALFYKYTTGNLQQVVLLNRLGGPDDPRPQGAAFRIFQGEGQAYGLELMVQQEGERFSNWLSYTYSRSQQRYLQAFRNEWFPAQDDRPHQLQWNGLLRAGKWSFSGTYVFATGAPFLDASLQAFAEERETADPGLYRRIDDYHRVDLGLQYQLGWESVDAMLGLSLYNVLDRDNTWYRQQLFGLPAVTNLDNRRVAVLGNELQLLGRTLSLSATVRW